MGLPSKRRTKSSKRRRASHFALGRLRFSKCASCSNPVLPHHVCLVCGKYQGRQVVAVRSRAEKSLKRREKERAREKAAQTAS